MERPATRPRRLEKNKDDDDDEPTYVDEESNEVISKEEYQALVQGSSQKAGESLAENKFLEGEDGKTNTQSESTPSKQNNLTEIGAQRKRKQAKVLAEGKAETEEELPKAPVSRKPKKQKKIKLSFDEE